MFRGNRGFAHPQMQRGGFHNQRSGMLHPNSRGEKIKFDGDFDFEKANEKFKEEIIDKMKELKVEEKNVGVLLVS